MSSDFAYRDRDTLIRLGAEMSDAQMAVALGCTPPTIRYWRDHHGLPRSTKKSAGGVKWQTDRDFFAEVNTPEKAYALGFIIADGAVHKNGKAVIIAIKESDSAILAAIATAARCDAPLRMKVSKGYSAVERRLAVLNLSGRKLVADLAALGVHPNKTFTATFPAIAPELERHLVRGLWDGDGWVGKKQFSLVGTKAVADGVIDAVWRHTGCRLAISLKQRHPDHPYAVGSRRDREAIRWMYEDAPISLERKAEAFRLYWS